MRREGAETKMSAMFYRDMAQALPIFGFEMTVIPVEMERKVKVTQTCFLRHITVKKRGGYMTGHGRLPGQK